MEKEQQLFEIDVDEEITEPRICASRGRNPDNPSSREKGEHLEQRIELGPKDLSNTLSTVQKDNYLVIPEEPMYEQLVNKVLDENLVEEGDVFDYTYSGDRLENFRTQNKENKDCSPTLRTKDAFAVVTSEEDNSMYSPIEKELFTEDGNIKRYLDSDIVDEFEEGQMATTDFPNGYGHGPRTHNESVSLTAVGVCPSVKRNYRIRKLTPKECYRLMGVSDEDSTKLLQVNSKQLQYHLTGDSIVTSCLVALLGQFFPDIDVKQRLEEVSLNVCENKENN